MDSAIFMAYWRLAHAVDAKVPSGQRMRYRMDLLSLGLGMCFGQGDRPVVNVSREEVLEDLRTALAAWGELSLGRHAVLAILSRRWIAAMGMGRAEVERRFDGKTAMLVEDLNHVYGLGRGYAAGQSETFTRLMVAVAKDVRVIMMLMARRLVVMRGLGEEEDDERRRRIASEALQLYAPLAHRMGLYAVKTELEDLGLKYTQYDVYKEIARKLNAKKRERDAYIERFIEPVRAKLEAAGLRFEIKGRTKSIYSIWRKMVRQGCDVGGVYDLFAIRIVIEADEEDGKAACWQAYAVVSDMYVPNTNRLRDWISVPKSNGYESLHTTVMGPEGKWVEVQIRTKYMDEVAERGVAAHWKYKGIKSEGAESEEWLRRLREVLEEGGEIRDGDEAQQRFKMQLYDDEVFVFTPKGELRQFPRGATVLDFAFDIHSRVGETAVGAKVNGRHVQIGYRMVNGDQVEIITQSNQRPKADWLEIVVTAKARQHIRRRLQEMEFHEAGLGKEIVDRKFRNWKLVVEPSVMERVAHRFGYDSLRGFYVGVNSGRVDLLDVREWILGQGATIRGDNAKGLGGYVPRCVAEGGSKGSVVIDGGVEGLEYEFAKCCNPVYGDAIFGFVGTHGGIKIHRRDCPNARDLVGRMHDRMVQVRWANEVSDGTEYVVNVRVIGNDDIGILSNITSVISNESGLDMTSLSVKSEDGLFEGDVSMVVREARQVDDLLERLRMIKGVKQAVRL
ncbi:MAG: TGS domain-containing protein [Paludibacteraceae bacterium]|nr:TGS domain-containing protein [Paludibacteraceae bacterium]